ncbi:MAG: MFS transporter, partial [Novosphingobium sp.]
MLEPGANDGRRQSPPWAVLTVLTIIFTVGFIDRQVINLLIQPIKHDFGLSDLKVSLLQGTAFIIAYLLASPFFGRWVDLTNRRNILLGCLVAWSGFTVLCGFATGFGGLFAARALVGLAEAGLTPACWSMLSDSFDEKRLARALSVYNIGPYIGGGLALLLGGVVLREAEGWDLSYVPRLSAAQPWQLTMMIVGFLGLVCAIPLLMIHEPIRRGLSRSDDDTVKRAIPVAEAFGTMRSRGRFYGCFFSGMALSVVPLYAFPAWIPALAVRQFHIPLAQVGLQYGLVTIVSGTVGVLVGPGLVAAMQRRFGFRDGNLRLGVITNLGVFASCILLFYRPSYPALLGISGIACFFYSMSAPPAGAALQIVTPNRMRGLATAIYLVVVGAAGLALSPVLVAFLTDRVFRDEVRVGDSLAIVCGVSALGAALVIWR